MYQIRWEIPNQVLFVELSQIVTVAEMSVINRKIVTDYLNHAKRPIHIIVSGANVQHLPVNIGDLREITHEVAAHPQLGHSIYFNMTHPLLAFVAHAVTRALKHDYSMVKSLEEAHEILRKL